MKQNSDLNELNHIDPIEEFTEEIFKRKYPELSKIIATANNLGHNFEFDLLGAKSAVAWYNNTLQDNIKIYMKHYGYKDILDCSFMIELKNDIIKTITLRDYITSVIGHPPIEVAYCNPFIFRTDSQEYTMDAEFEIKKYNFSISNSYKILSNGQKFTDVLLDVLTTDTRIEIIESYGADETLLSEIYFLLQQLIESSKTDWQILKELQQSYFFMNTFAEIFVPYLLDKGKEEYLEIVEIITS